jgi:hypothetical protein
MAKDKDYMSKENDFLNPDRNYAGLETDFSKEKNYFSEDRSYNPRKYFNKKNKSKSGDSMLLGLIAGAAAGLIAGILMAPDKGSETRRTLSQKGRETVDNLKGKVNDLVDTVADKYMSGKPGKDDQGNFGDSGLDRTRSTASHVTPGSPSTKSFT